jgi:hypothetical protein
MALNHVPEFAALGGERHLLAVHDSQRAVDDASNITYDPASGLALAWTARNQMAAASEGVQETYDGLGRREQSGVANDLHFLHDGGSVLGSADSFGDFWDFLSLPGGGASAGSSTVSGTTPTWVPLIDASGSTIALVNAASTQSGPGTTYTYDPAGTPSVSGAANDWPFLYQGGEKEFTDPGPLYYSGSGQFYSPQLVRSLSETGQTSSNGNNAGPAGSAMAQPSGDLGSNYARPSENVGGDAAGGFLLGSLFIAESGATLGPPGALVGAILGGIAYLFEDLFGGSSNPPPPRQLVYARHPLYPVILGVSDDLIPDQVSAAPDPSDVTSTNFISPVAFIIPFQSLPEDYNEPPGPEWEQRGPNWFNPKTRQSLHPDPNHALPKGPHYDLHNRHPKWSLSIRPYNGGLQFWNEDLMEELPLEWLPLGLLP